MVTVEVKNLNKSYGKLQVLKNINLKIDDGELFVVIGPSGSGKSTLLRIIAGLESFDSGVVSFDGKDVSGIPPNKRGIGMVFQDYAVWPHMTVEQNIKFVIKEKESNDEILDDVLEKVGLLQKKKRMPSELSGGELQRVAIARALAVRPRLFLMDEPLSNLDEKIRKELLVEILDIIKENNLTTLFITHSQEEAFEIGDRMAVINKGIIEQIGTADEFINEPKTSFVARFIGENLVLKGEILEVGDSLSINFDGIGRISIAPRNKSNFSKGSKVTMITRISDLKITEEEKANSFKTRLISKKMIKDKTKAYLETNNLIRIALEVDSIWHIDANKKINLEIPDHKAFLFNE